MMKRMSKVINKNRLLSALQFKPNKDGSIYYEYKETTNVSYVHGGKMISPEKNDIYERIITYSGTIYKDGLRKRNKDSYTDTLIKKGRMKK